MTIRNDGKGIPVLEHPTEKMYIPELVFGHLLTGSNFDDSQKSLTGGRHGYGAKLTNIFSSEFQVQTYDSQQGKLYTQNWEKNMSIRQEPDICQDYNPLDGPSKDFTQISFTPDLKRFYTKSGNTEEFGPDTVQKKQAKTAQATSVADTVLMFQRRCLDIAACVAPIAVTYNGQRLPIGSFKDYVNMFDRSATTMAMGDRETTDEPGHNSNDLTSSSHELAQFAHPQSRWEVALKRSPTGAFAQMSFVNNVWTPAGGSHVEEITQQIVAYVLKKVNTGSKHGKVTQSMIRNRLMVFVNCLVENPSFDSQSKDSLTTNPRKFGSKPELTQKFICDAVTELGLLDEISAELAMREQSKLLRASAAGKRSVRGVNIPKLEDAHLAGGRRSLECSLVLTEGDSAKALAVAGLEMVGRETYGVLPLRGKVLNVTDFSPRELLQNTELMNFCRAMGLDFGATYEDGLENKGLRYGRVLLMTDQDQDGTHIKGLVINFFNKFWPYLLRTRGFLQQFSTPLVKVNILPALSSSC